MTTINQVDFFLGRKEKELNKIVDRLSELHIRVSGFDVLERDFKPSELEIQGDGVLNDIDRKLSNLSDITEKLRILSVSLNDFARK